MLLAAEGVDAECSSRGMYVWAWEPGASAAPLALELMASEGAHSITQHRAMQLTEDELRAADLAIVMTRAHREALEETPAAEGVDVRLLTSFVDGGAEDVPDPYFGRARTPTLSPLPATAAQARVVANAHRRSVSRGAPVCAGHRGLRAMLRNDAARPPRARRAARGSSGDQAFRCTFRIARRRASRARK